MKKSKIQLFWAIFILVSSIGVMGSFSVYAAPLKPTLTITIHEIQGVDWLGDSIETDTTPDWLYEIRIWDGNDWIDYERTTVVHNGVLTSGNVHNFSLLYQTGNTTKFYITLFEKDFYITDPEVSDISSNDGTIQPSQRGTAPRGAQFYGVYNLITKTMTSESDTTGFDGTYYFTSGDFDGSTDVDENDANLWFDITTNYESPIANAGEHQDAVLDSNVFFNGSGSTASSGSSIVSYKWDYESDGVYDAQGANPGYVYTTKGLRTVTLQVTDSIGTTAIDTTTIFIINLFPEASFNISVSEATIFDNITFIDYSVDYDGEVTHRLWDFGDGSISTSKNSLHNYNLRGDYNVTLNVWDDTGDFDSTSQIINIVNVAPIADFFLVPPDSKIAKAINFEDKSIDPEGYPLVYLWDFGDGRISTESNPNYAYENSGNMTVTLTVTDDLGAQSSKTSYIIIRPNIAPTAGFSYAPENQLINHDINFYDLSNDADGYMVGWNWNFGDGSKSNLKDPVHRYTVGGNYSVSLTSIDENGDTDTIFKKVFVVQTYDMTVKVRDLFGSNMGDAEIKVYGDNNWYQSGSTDSQGSITLRELLKGEYTIETQILGLTTSSTVELEDNTTETMTVTISMSTVGVTLGVLAFAVIVVFYLKRRPKIGSEELE